MTKYKEVEVIVSLGGYELETWVDVPTNYTKQQLFQFILGQVELDYDDEWVRED